MGKKKRDIKEKGKWSLNPLLKNGWIDWYGNIYLPNGKVIPHPKRKGMIVNISGI